MKAILVVGIIIAFVAAENYEYYSCFRNHDTGKYSVKKGKDEKKAVAWALWGREVDETGWDRLYITTNPRFSDDQQMYGAGYLEGSITTDRIWDSWGSYVNATFTNGIVPQSYITWFQTNLEWMQQQVQNNEKDPYWIHVGLVLQQLEGLTQGYSDHAEAGQEMDIISQILQNADGDLGDLANIIPSDEEKLYIRNNKVIDQSQYLYGSHCSALIKPSTNKKELYSAHTTWSGYNTMLRIYKIYNFPLHNNATVAINVSFSSYPSCLESIDDFYITSSGLAVIETTNEIFNTTLYQQVVPQSLLSWVRTIVANRLATDGESWTTLFAKYNSGTYNNQWMITDYKKFQQGSSQLPDGTLWILEQIPGYCESADVTPIVNSQGYWPSYNIPYFPNIFAISGYLEMQNKYGDSYSYSMCPRAQIFRRDQSKAGTLDGMKFIMRYNDYQNDPLSLGDAGNAISSRFDLDQTNSNAFGGIDSKITSHSMIKYFEAIGISGPTFYQQRAFNWSAFESTPHYGQPEVFNFGWHTFKH